MIPNISARLVAALLMAAGCSHGMAQTLEYRVTGAVVAANGGTLTIIDRRAPDAERGLKVTTPQGELDRVLDSRFEQPPMEAVGNALAEQSGRTTSDANLEPVQMLVLDIAIGEKKGSAAAIYGNGGALVNMQGTVLQQGMQLGIANVLGNLIAAKLLQSVADSHGSRAVFVTLSLKYRDNEMTCRGVGSFSDDAVSMGWQTALREASARCAPLIGPPPPLNDPLPNRVH